MAFDFPSSPTEGQEFTPPGGPTYVWSTPSWKAKMASNGAYVAKAGDTMTGDLTISEPSPAFRLRKSASGQSNYITGSLGTGSASQRWVMELGNNTAESGSNSGSDFALASYDDAGAFLRQNFSISRQTGQINLNGSPIWIAQGRIQFPSTANPSTDLYTLDDYHEGNWVPTLQFGGAAVGMTYTTRGGVFVKVGRNVFVTGRITLSAKGTSTGSATVTSLPFTSQDYAGLSMPYYSNFAGLTGYTPMPLVNPLQQLFDFRTSGGATGSLNLTDVHFSNTADLIFSGVYMSQN